MNQPLKMKTMVLLGLTFVCLVLASLFHPIAQLSSYHNFGDERALWGIPNFANVVSNVPFLLTGLLGLLLVQRFAVTKRLKIIYSILFIGVALVAFGSGYYHLHPDNYRLIFDRIPMTIAFMSLFSATIAEFINEKNGYRLIVPLLIIGIGSVFYWQYTESQRRGDLRPYLVVQFYPVIFIPLIMILFPSETSRRAIKPLIWAVIWYVIAKFFETYDKEIYNELKVVSGHTLKHLAASVSTYCLVILFRRKKATTNRAIPGK